MYLLLMPRKAFQKNYLTKRFRYNYSFLQAFAGLRNSLGIRMLQRT